MADDGNIMSFLQGATSGQRNNCWGDGGWAWIVLLFLFMFGGFGGGNMWGRNNNGIGTEALLDGQNSIKNQMGYDNLAGSIRGVQQGIADSTYAVNNTLNGGFRGVDKGICDSTFALNNTMVNGFASVQSALCQGFNGVNTAINNTGFNLADKMNSIAASQNLQLQSILEKIQSCCCELKTSSIANTQKILDKMCSNTEQDLRDKLYAASQREQTLNIVSQLKTTPAA